MVNRKVWHECSESAKGYSLPGILFCVDALLQHVVACLQNKWQRTRTASNFFSQRPGARSALRIVVNWIDLFAVGEDLLPTGVTCPDGLSQPSNRPGLLTIVDHRGIIVDHRGVTFGLSIRSDTGHTRSAHPQDARPRDDARLGHREAHPAVVR
jgi:hypothetical protein